LDLRQLHGGSVQVDGLDTALVQNLDRRGADTSLEDTLDRLPGLLQHVEQAEHDRAAWRDCHELEAQLRDHPERALGADDQLRQL
jgi:hypothetical protein